jgi:1,4-alpha-glucan branching enzyme
MLYRDYSRASGEWVPNRYGGRENLEAADFLRQTTDLLRARHPDVLLIAEESTAWPGVTSPTDQGGLGFTHKWDMGWMHDTLGYLEREPVHRRFHQNDLTFRGLYLGSERWVLPLSHDEVVHGKGALLAKMPGDDWQRRAGLRLLYGYQWGSLGAKLLFMGGELGQTDEWSHTRSLDWHLLDDPAHAGLADWLRVLNGLYRSHPSLEDHGDSFWWIACVDAANSVFAWARQASGGGNQTVWVANFTPLPRSGYRVGLPEGGRWRLLLNGDDSSFGGSGHPVVVETEAESVPWDGQAQSAVLTLPPLAILVYGR